MHHGTVDIAFGIRRTIETGSKRWLPGYEVGFTSKLGSDVGYYKGEDAAVEEDRGGNIGGGNDSNG